jgi:anti-sigma factor RsiW
MADMNDETPDLVLRAVTGELSAAERDLLDARAADDPGLRAELEEARRTAALLRGVRVEGFPAGFGARLALRIAEEGGRRSPFSASLLQRQFLRLLAPTLAALVVLMAYALRGPHRFHHQSAVESLLGLTPITGESWIMAEPPRTGGPRGDGP